MTATATRPPKLPAGVVQARFWRVSSSALQAQRRPLPVDPGEQARLGRAAPHDPRAEVRQQRSVIVGYIEDGPNLVVLAMNGWDEGHPAWWLNLEAHPDASVRLRAGIQRPVTCSRPRGRARSTVAALGRGRRGARRVCRYAVDRDPGRRARTARQPTDVHAEVPAWTGYAARR